MDQVRNKLIPSVNMHLKDINTGDIYDTYIYLGKGDTFSNYVEVSEEEYQKFLQKQTENVETE